MAQTSGLSNSRLLLTHDNTQKHNRLVDKTETSKYRNTKGNHDTINLSATSNPKAKLLPVPKSLAIVICDEALMK